MVYHPGQEVSIPKYLKYQLAQVLFQYFHSISHQYHLLSQNCYMSQGTFWLGLLDDLNLPETVEYDKLTLNIDMDLDARF